MDNEALLDSLNVKDVKLPKDQVESEDRTYFLSLLPAGLTVEQYEGDRCKKIQELIKEDSLKLPYKSYEQADEVARALSALTNNTVIIRVASQFRIEVGNCYIHSVKGADITLNTESYFQMYNYRETMALVTKIKEAGLTPRVYGSIHQTIYISPPSN
jgi:hypothetical protein